jgi:Rad3-related DNA helicase
MDITLDQSVLIFDEAHNIEDTARYTSSSSHTDALMGVTHVCLLS